METGARLEDWQYRLINIMVYKCREDRWECANYRRLNVLRIAGETEVRILLSLVSARVYKEGLELVEKWLRNRERIESSII